MLTLEEYMHKRGTTDEQRARINTHKNRLIATQTECGEQLVNTMHEYNTP